MSAPARWALGVSLVGCVDPDRDGGTVERPDAPPAPDTSIDPGLGDTDPSSETSEPVIVDAACTPTPNALRFDCAVTVDPAQPVQIAFAMTDGSGPERVHASDLVATEHDIALYFMEPETEYSLEVSAPETPAALVFATSIVTGAPPDEVRSSLLVTGDSSVPMIGTHLPCDDEPAIAVIYSTVSGRLLWYQLLDPDGSLDALHMLQFTEDHTVLGDTDESVVEVDLVGNQILRLDRGTDFDLDLHHDLFKRNGQYYLLYQEDFPDGLSLDSVVVLDSLGAELARWRSVERLDIPPDAGGDWLHTNAIFVQPTGEIVLSLYSRSSVLMLEGDVASWDFGTTRWILAGVEPAELGQDFDVDWERVGGGDAFRSQHSVLVRNDGRLMLLDNLSGRGLVLSYDEPTWTATVEEAWDTVEPTCGQQGTARDSLAGNSFVGCDGDQLREYDPAAGLVWEAKVDCGGSDAYVARFYPLDGW